MASYLKICKWKQIIAPANVFLLLLLFSFQFSLTTNAHGDRHHGDTANESTTGDDHQVNSSNNKSLILVKIWCLLIFFFSTLGFGISPYFLSWNDSFLLLGNQFAAGIFLSTSFMHFLPESTATFQLLTSTHYPIAYLLACIGYLLTMFGDLIISFITKTMTGDAEVQIEGKKILVDLEDQQQSHCFLRNTSLGDTLLLVFALCFHSIFEGLAVGVAGSEADAWKILWTVSMHNVFAGISMGIAVLKTLPMRPLRTILGYSFAFGISTPVGVGIGLTLHSTTEGRTADWIFAISIGLASGIFIYVSINHLIAKGYKPRSFCVFDTPVFKFLAVFAGVTVMAIVMFFE